MKKVSLLVAFVGVFGLVGCTVPSTLHKEVVVTEDGNGKVISKIYTESITQSDQKTPLTFKYLRKGE